VQWRVGLVDRHLDLGAVVARQLDRLDPAGPHPADLHLIAPHQLAGVLEHQPVGVAASA
jgi:hypothetical protein